MAARPPRGASPVEPRPVVAEPVAEPPPSSSGPSSEDAPHRDLIVACRQELESAEGIRAARLHFEIARTHVSPARAAEHYERALEALPNHLPSIRGLRAIRLAEGDAKGAAALYAAEARLAEEPGDRALLHVAEGQMLKDVGGDEASARERYHKALSLDRTRPQVLRAVQQIEHAGAQWTELQRAQAHEANAAKADPRHRAALLVARAQLLETRLDGAREAVDLYNTALQLDPQVAGALSSLERLLDAQGRWRELVAALHGEVARSQDAETKVMALYQVARIHSERLGNTAEAIQALVHAEQILPAHRLVLDELVRLYELSDDTAGLARALQSLARAVQDDAECVQTLHRIGEIYDRRHGDDVGAAPFYEAALAIDPTFEPSLRALDRLYTDSERFESLIAMHLGETRASSSPLRRAMAHARVGELLETRLGKPAEAAEHYARAIGLAPELDSPFKALVRLLRAGRRYQELIELYERAIDRTGENDVVVAYLFTVGGLYEDALGNLDGASYTYRRILERDPANLGAIHALQRVSEAGGHHLYLVEALQREAELAGDAERVKALLHRAGEIYELRTRDRDAAEALYRRVLDLDTKYLPALRSLARLYHRTRRSEDLIEVCARQLAVTPEESMPPLLCTLAELTERHLGDTAGAIGYLRRAVAIDPSFRPAHKALSVHLHRSGDFAGLAQAMRTELGTLDEPHARARAAYQLGVVCEVHLGDLEGAASAYRQAVEAVPGHRAASDGVVRVTAARKQWREVADALLGEALASEPRAAIDALLRAGRIFTDHLDEPRRAIDAYTEILRLDPHCVSALLALEPLYRDAEAWEELAENYDAQARVLSQLPARVAALEELARLQRSKGVGGEAGLRRTLNAILTYDPHNPTALAMLEALALQSGDLAMLAEVDSRSLQRTRDPDLRAAHALRLGESHEAAGDLPSAMQAFRSALDNHPGYLGAMRGLGRVAGRLGDASAMVEAARREAEWTRDDDLAAALLVRSARMLIDRLGDAAAAVEDAERALRRAPGNEGAARLLTQLMQGRDVPRLIDELSRAAGACADAERQAALWLQVARLHAERRQDVPAGMAAVNRALQAHPAEVDALMLAAHLLGQQGRWPDAAERLERVVELAPGAQVLVEAHLQLARIHGEHLRAPHVAKQHLELVLARNDAQRDALTMLVELEAAGDGLPRAVEAATRLVDTSKDAVERSEALVRLGRLQVQAADPSSAGDSFREAIVLQGPVGSAATEYKKLLGTDEPWHRYTDALLEHLRHISSGAAPARGRWRAYHELAAVQHDKLHEPDEAIATLQAGLRACDEHPALALALAERLAGRGRYQDARASFVSLTSHDPANAAAWRGLARTLQEQGRKVEASLAAGPLVVLGEATLVEQNLAAECCPRPGAVRAGSFGPRVLHHISAGDSATEGLVAGVLMSVGEALARLYPPRFEQLGRERLAADHPLRAMVERLTDALEIERVEVYACSLRASSALVELGRPAVLLVPADLAQVSEAEQVFLLARALVPLARNLHALARLGPVEVRRVIVAVVRSVDVSYGNGRFAADGVADLQRRVLKALPWGGKKVMEQAALKLAAAGVDLDRWLQTDELTSTCAAALLASDLPAVAGAIRRCTPAFSALEGAALVQASPALAHTLRFWMSDAASELRRAAGLT